MALSSLDDERESADVRDNLAELGYLAYRLEYHDVAICAITRAVELDASPVHRSHLNSDRIMLGNILSRLGDPGAAEQEWRRVMRDAGSSGEHADCASAATNVAGELAQADQLQEAASLLRRALDLLGTEPFPETERNARLMLVQILAMQGGHDEELLEVALPLRGMAHELGENELAALRELAGQALRTRPEYSEQFFWLGGV